MVVVVTYHRVVVNRLQETTLQVDQVSATCSHHVHETLHQPLDLLVVVQFIGEDGGNGEDPGGILEGDWVIRGDAVPNEEAEGQVDEEGLRRLVDELNGVQVHLKFGDLDRSDGPDGVLGKYLIRT